MAGLILKIGGLFLLAGSAGCVSLIYERDLIGHGGFSSETWKLKVQESTIQEVFDRLGPPDLVLRVGHVDRAYYTSWDGSYFKILGSLSLPLIGRNFSWDLFILTLGGETMRLVRLEFDRQGILQALQQTTMELSRSGQYITVDDRIVSSFL